MHVLLVPRAAVLACPLQHLEVAAQRRVRARQHPRHVSAPTANGRASQCSRAPTSTPRGSLPPRASTSTSPTGSFARAHFSVRLGVAALARVRAVPRRPTGGARPLQHLEVAAQRLAARDFSTSTRSTGSRSRAPTSAPRGGRPRAASAHVALGPRAVVLARPLQHLEVAAPNRARARPLVPRACCFVLARPLQHLEVAALRRVRARRLVPRAVVRARPLQHLEVAARPPALSRRSACPTGSRSRAPTSAPRGGRRSPRSRTSACPTGSRSRAPTSASRGGRPRRERARPSTHGKFSARRSAFNASRSPPSRSCSAEETLVKQSTSSTQTLERCSRIRARRHRIDRTPQPSARSRPPRRRAARAR